MDGDDAPGLLRDALGGVLGGHGVGVVDVDEDGDGAGVDERLDGGEGGEGGDEDLVAGGELAEVDLGEVQEVDGGGPGAGEDDVLHAEPRRQFLLECLALGAEDVVAAFDDFENSAVDRFALIDPRERDFGRHVRLLEETVKT